MRFRLHVFVDPQKDVRSKTAANAGPGGYSCGCPVSEAVARAIHEEGRKRFRRWASVRVNTGLFHTRVEVTDRDGSRRQYTANLPSSLVDVRVGYDKYGAVACKRAMGSGASGVLEFSRYGGSA